MTNPYWKKNGRRYSDPLKLRSQYRFRRHVRSPSNPKGRIVRMPCFMYWRGKCDCTEGEAHHPDHEQPFVVVWVCPDHHRAVERKEITFMPVRDVFNYESLIPQMPTRQLSVRRGEGVRALKAAARAASGVPF